jgi:RNA polymerase sigma factor (sigma-70 family)
LKKVSSNLLVSHYRHMKHQGIPISELISDNDITAAQSPEVATMLHIALDKLRPRQAWLIEAFHFDGKGMAEIADELGISERAAEGRMRRAREALKTHLGT